MSQAGIVDFIGTHPEVPILFVANVGNAVPIANTLEILGSAVAAHSVPLETLGSGNTIDINVQYASAAATSVVTNAGIASFNSADFSVDANGFVTILGTAAVESFQVDAATAPGTNPVIPSGSGVVTITGGQVAAGTTTNVIRANSLAANTYTIQIQRSQAVGVSTVGDNGVSHFNSTYFTVDSDGFVSINGAAIGETITGNTGGALSPTAGNWNILGSAVAAGTTPIQTSGSISTLTIQVQRAQAIATTNATNVGLAAFDNTKFTVDSNGFVSINGSGIGETITGTTGGALSPTLGNWNILGTSTASGATPVQTSGSGSTLTVQVQKAQAIATTNATNVGLAAFDSARFSVDANGFVSTSGTGIGQTITGDTGGPLSPTGGNWNIVSTATNGIETTGSGSSLTVAMSSPYADGDFEFRSSVSGQTRTMSVTNTSNTASSQATILTSVAGTTAGDVWNQYTVGTTRTYAEGIDNSDSQKLKLTTNASNTANPSTANPIWSFTPGTGFVYDNTGTSGYGIGFGASPSAAYNLTLQSSVNSFYGINLNNTNGSSGALCGINFNCDGADSTISIPSSTNSVVAIRNNLFFNATNHLIYNVASSKSHLWYVNVAGGGLVMTANSSGLTMSTPITIGTQQIFTTRQTTPSAGTIGEQIRSQVAVGSATTLTTGTGTNYTSISLTAGVWDLSSICMLNGTVTGTIVQHSITTSSTGSGAVVGDNRVDGSWLPTAATDVYYAIPSYRVILTSTTTYYANIAAAFTSGTCKAYGRLSATRVA